MPAAIAAVLPAIFGSAGAFALVAVGGGLTVLGYGVAILGSLAVSAISQKLAQQSLQEPPESKLSNIRANAPSADAARLKFYGENRVGGTPVFIRAKENTLHRVIVHGHGQSDSILKYYLDQKAVELDGNNFVTDSQYIEGGKKVQINTARGYPAGYHLQRLSGVFPEWTSSHSA